MSLEHHPLYPGESIPFFIAPGVLRESSDVQSFEAIEDPNMIPLLFFGGFSLNPFHGIAPQRTDFVYDANRRAAGNCRGFPNGGRHAVESLKPTIRRLSARGVKTVIQITNLAHEDPLQTIPYLAPYAAEAEPTAIEVNLSCPNGWDTYGRPLPPTCNNADLSGELVRRVRRKIGYEICMGIKDGPHTDSYRRLVDTGAIGALLAATQGEIDFITGINSIGNQPFAALTGANGRGGMSGPIIAPVARQHMAATREAAPDLAYLSCGGIDSVNAHTEIPERLSDGAMRVGGAQEFYRTYKPERVVERWAQAIA